jgi:hypothetical protein
LSSSVMVPSYGRGFAGGIAGGRGGGFGGFDRSGFDRAGFDRGGFGQGGFDRAFDNADRAGLENSGWNGVRNYDYGGGFNRLAESRPSIEAPAAADRPNLSQITGHNPSELVANGSLGSISMQNRFNNWHPQQFNEANLSSQGEAIRNSFNHNTINNYGGYHNYTGYHPYGAYGYHPYYHPYAFYGYPGGWYNPGFMEASMWTCMGLSTLTSFLGIAALSSLNNGTSDTNVTYEGGNTYINMVPAPDYYQQGQQLAGLAGGNVAMNAPLTAFANQGSQVTSDIGQPPIQGVSPAAATEKWEPLGVYSLCTPGQKESTTLFQLAINKDGVVRGNYMNEITNEKAQVHGALDKKTQRISWTVGNNPETIFSTTLNELVKQDSKILVQFGPNNTQEMAFIRLPAPKNGDATKISEPS